VALGFAPGKKKGQHYELAMFALNKAKKVNLLLKGQTEKHFEFTIVSHLQSSPRLRKNLVTQIGMDEVEKMTKASLFGFSHWPDVSIGNSGTAIEIKVVQGGPGMRDILGQAIAYRMHYRFVILVVIDQTPECKIVELCRDKTSQEYRLLSGLADELNVFSIVGPLGQSKNVVFSGRRPVAREGKHPMDGKAEVAPKVAPKPKDDSTPSGL
jgi:hypothetical protein